MKKKYILVCPFCKNYLSEKEKVEQLDNKQLVICFHCKSIFVVEKLIKNYDYFRG